jgi:hypothetical protein
MRRALAVAALLAVALASAVTAQQPDSMQAAAARAEDRMGSVIGVAKWAALGVAAAGAAYGFRESERADDLYQDLERACQADPLRCSSRTDGGAYSDPALEADYQTVLDIDRSTRSALFVGQAALLTSAVLFILDLRGDDERPDIPYEPPQIRLAPGAGGGLELRLQFD